MAALDDGQLFRHRGRSRSRKISRVAFFQDSSWRGTIGRSRRRDQPVCEKLPRKPSKHRDNEIAAIFAHYRSQSASYVRRPLTGAQAAWLMSADVRLLGGQTSYIHEGVLSCARLRKLAAVVAAAAAIAVGFGSADANAAPRCRAAVEGAATATGILGSGSAKARVEARANWQATARSLYGPRYAELLERPEQAVGLQEGRDTACKMRRRRQALPLLNRRSTSRNWRVRRDRLTPAGPDVARCNCGRMPRMGYQSRLQAPVAQLDRALPSEGRGHRFESCRVRHLRTKERNAGTLLRGPAMLPRRGRLRSVYLAHTLL